jgi:hypothetical protein
MSTATPTAKLLIGSTNVVELSDFHDTETDDYPEDATVVGALSDPAGNAVAGASAIAMAKVAGTSGAATRYRGIVPYTAPLIPTIYLLRVTATIPTGEVRTFDIRCQAQRG